MKNQGIAPHEALELHEILTFKNICLTKSLTMSKLVSDSELKSIMQHDADLTEQHIMELSGLMSQSALLDTGTSQRNFKS